MSVACSMDCFLGIQVGLNGEAVPPPEGCWVAAEETVLVDVLQVWVSPLFLFPFLGQELYLPLPLPLPHLSLTSLRQCPCHFRPLSASLHREKGSENRMWEGPMIYLHLQVYIYAIEDLTFLVPMPGWRRFSPRTRSR